jgi:hypothetical protein
MVTPGIEVTSLFFASDEEKVPNLKNKNEVLGDYVTAGARLRLTIFSEKRKKTRYIATLSLLSLYRKKANLH